MANCLIPAVERYCPAAVGAVKQLTLYIPAETTSVPDPGCGVYVGTDPVSDSAITIPFDRFSCQHTSKGATDARPGDYWAHTVVYTMRRHRAELGLWMQRMKNRRFHVIVEDWYGERLFFKNMRLTSGRTLEKNFSGKNELDFLLDSRSKHPGIYLMPTQPPVPPTGVWGDPGANEQWGDPGADEVWGW